MSNKLAVSGLHMTADYVGVMVIQCQEEIKEEARMNRSIHLIVNEREQEIISY